MSFFLLGPDPSGQCCGCETRFDPCDPCSGHSGSCFCFLPIPGLVRTGIEYAFTMTSGAQYQIEQRTSNCITWAILANIDPITDDSLPLTVDLLTGVGSTSSLGLSGHIHADPLSSFAQDLALGFYSSITVPDSTILTLNYNVTGGPFNAFGGGTSLYVYPCQTPGSTDITFTRFFGAGARGTTTLPSVGSLSAGTYQIGFTADAEGGPSSDLIGEAYMTFSNPIVVNPVVAFYNESITGQRQLEACPKTLLPCVPFSPPNDLSPCVNLASAQAFMDDPDYVTVDCLAKFMSLTNLGIVTSASVSEGPPTTISLSLADVGSTAEGFLFTSINLTKDDTFTLDYNITFNVANLGNGGVVLDIYGSTFPVNEAESVYTNVVFCNGTTSLIGSLPSFVAPYTGKYYILIVTGSSTTSPTPPFSSSVSATYTLTSTGDISINPVAIEYDVGLDCPAILNCTP